MTDEERKTIHEKACKWFKEAQFGGMAHFGLYSLLACEWNNQRPWMPYSEWIQSHMYIPHKEYARLAEAFNPIFFDADEWIMRVRDAGMKYFVFTSKHHDGFAMYHSRASAYNVVDATPFKRDIVGELAEACRKHGVKLGLYYSQDYDWADPDGGGYKTIDKDHSYMGHLRDCSNHWDWPDRDKKDYARYFERKVKPQVEEILTQYGDLCLVWFDVPTTINAAQSKELREFVKKLQPGCLINSRIGNGFGDYDASGDNAAPTKKATGLAEMCCSMNESWGYSPMDRTFKTVQQVLDLKKKCRDLNWNYLLNFGPDGLGRIPVDSLQILEGLAKAKLPR